MQAPTDGPTGFNPPETPRLPYSSPQLKDYGSLREVTRTDDTGPFFDGDGYGSDEVSY